MFLNSQITLCNAITVRGGINPVPGLDRDTYLTDSFGTELVGPQLVVLSNCCV